MQLVKMKEMREDILEKYAHMGVDEVERRIDWSITNTKLYLMEITEMLYFLETTKRFRDNPVYKKATFETYLSERYNLKKSDFHKNRKAFFNYPSESEKYGPGFVYGVLEKTNLLKAPEVFEEIEQFESKKARPATVEERKLIIDKHSPPKKEISKISQIDYRGRYQESQALIVEMRKEIKMKDEQIAKLKEALSKHNKN